MFRVDKLNINNKEFYAYTVLLPKTTLLVIANEVGYFSCRAIDIDVFDSLPHLRQRKVVCGCCEGVKSIDDLLHAPLVKVTEAAKELGITVGMPVKEALDKLV